MSAEDRKPIGYAIMLRSGKPYGLYLTKGAANGACTSVFGWQGLDRTLRGKERVEAQRKLAAEKAYVIPVYV